MSNKKKKNITLGDLMLIIIFIFIAILILVGNLDGSTNTNTNTSRVLSYNDKVFKIISSQENKQSENFINEYAASKGYNIAIEYAGTLDIIEKLNNNEYYDAVWLSNSIWSYMLDSSVSLSNSKCTSINPIVFGIKRSKAEDLGFVGKEVYTKDLVQKIANGDLKFSMSNPTSTNSGASAYLGMLQALAGNPEVLTEDILQNDELQNNLKTLFTGMERSSGSEDFLEELFLNGDYEAVVSYESSIININKQLAAQGKETLYAVYPVDGVSISDSPFAFIDHKNENKKEIFTDIQSYLLSNEGQKELARNGKRTWYGGVTDNADKTIFNPDWGIDTNKYISPIKYPSTKVIKLALNLYQTALRKPVHVVFCLDYSGSMFGNGYNELVAAMEYILTDKAADDFIQFSDKDKIDIIPFASKSYLPWSTSKGTDTEELLKNIKSVRPNGTTALYPAARDAINLLKDEDTETYNLSVVLMTDGEGNEGNYTDLYNLYTELKVNIPIYSIMFGDARDYQLNGIASLTNGKVFDGKENLVKAFKEVRGYN